MAVPITYLRASDGTHLIKQFEPTRTVAYPLVRNVTSQTLFFEPSFEGLEAIFASLQDAARTGAALLKGTLTKELVNETRAGKTDNHALTNTLWIDVDGLELPTALQKTTMSNAYLIDQAEFVVSLLPPEFNAISYIAHASSSAGVKGTSHARVHLFFILANAVSPKSLQTYLTDLNFTHDTLADSLSLSNTKNSLKFTIDPRLGLNSQLLYIAHPVFTGTANPFSDDAQRWALVRKGHAALNIVPSLANLTPDSVRGKILKHLAKLRKAIDLPVLKPKYKSMRDHHGQMVNVLTNPGSMDMQVAYTNGDFIYFNINGGDSNAYYCLKHNPDIVHNFKGEAPFELARAAPELYEQLTEQYQDVIQERNPELPVAFRDFQTDKHYACLVNPGEDNVVRLASIQKQNLEDWMAEYGRSVPDPIPTWDIVFDPKNDMVYDRFTKTLNTYQRTDYMKRPTPILPQNIGRVGEAADKLALLCPIIHKTLFHICGNAALEFELFINWLASALQSKEKLYTAWIFSGTPGTGKGVFYEHILTPLIGEPYVQKKRVDHLEDQFNAYARTALFTVFEEFRLADAKSGSRTLNRIKDEIGGDTITIRAMQTEQVKARSYSNYIIFSNHNDVIQIEDGDRRFNVCPPQRIKIIDAFPAYRDEVGLIKDELATFAGFLLDYEADIHLARTPVENQAKTEMRKNSLTWNEQFALALKDGDLDYFLDDWVTFTNRSDLSVADLIKKPHIDAVMRNWIDGALRGEYSVTMINEVQTLFEWCGDTTTTTKKMTRMLHCNDIVTSKAQRGGVRGMAVRTLFHTTASREELLELLNVKPADKQQFNPKHH